MSSGSAPITLSSLTYLQGKTLAPLLLEPTEQAKIAVIDVRDSDHIGGNIKGSTWIPLNQLDVRIPELLRTLKDKEKVVFHCMLSQQRGPRAALMYARAKHAHDSKQQKAEQSGEEAAPSQKVCVLEGGFGQWQAQFGEDPRLTADYVPDIWI
ncbi:Cdc25 phosphatase Ibp1 [Rhinocladiella similis]